MTNLNTKMDDLTNLITGKTPLENKTQDQTQFSQSSNSLQGEPRGTES